MNPVFGHVLVKPKNTCEEHNISVLLPENAQGLQVDEHAAETHTDGESMCVCVCVCVSSPIQGNQGDGWYRSPPRAERGLVETTLNTGVIEFASSRGRMTIAGHGGIYT